MLCCLCVSWYVGAFLYFACVCYCVCINRPIVLLGSGFETEHPDQGQALFTQLCFAENSEARSSCHPLQLSCPLFLQESFSFQTVVGFFDWQMVVPSFLFSKSCATGGQTLRRPDNRSTCTAHRMRSHC